MHSKARLVLALAIVLAPFASDPLVLAQTPSNLDEQLRVALQQAGFTGTVGSTI